MSKTAWPGGRGRCGAPRVDGAARGATSDSAFFDAVGRYVAGSGTDGRAEDGTEDRAEQLARVGLRAFESSRPRDPLLRFLLEPDPSTDPVRALWALEPWLRWRCGPGRTWSLRSAEAPRIGVGAVAFAALVRALVDVVCGAMPFGGVVAVSLDAGDGGSEAVVTVSGRGGITVVREAIVDRVRHLSLAVGLASTGIRCTRADIDGLAVRATLPRRRGGAQ